MKKRWLVWLGGGYLNRWNDTMGTLLEAIPENFVEKKLKPLGWIQE